MNDFIQFYHKIDMFSEFITKYIYGGGIIVFLAIWSCRTDSIKASLGDAQDLDYEIIRYERLLAQGTSIANLYKDYPRFSDLYFKEILGLGNVDSPDSLQQELILFLQDSIITELFDHSEAVYGDSSLKEDFDQAFLWSRHYFPELQIPNIYTYISEYNYQCIILEDEMGEALGVGLDMFLGSDYPYKLLNPKNPSFSDYLTRSFNKDHVVRKTLDVWLDDQIPAVEKNQLLDYMIRAGKKLYILDKLLPEVNDTIITEFSQEQYDWCLNNEVQMWGFLFDKNLFYNTNLQQIDRLTRPAPSSAGMPPESPGQAVNYIGWKIVDSYVQRQKISNLNDLLFNVDAQQILEASGYRPKLLK